MKKFYLMAFAVLLCSGCASVPQAGKSPEGAREQIEAAKKVVGAMAPSKNAGEKYSPVTGKHYSGTLEFEPGTGARLIPVEE